MTSLSAVDGLLVRQNLFPESAESALGRVDFPWHRDAFGAVTAMRPESSQALAIDVFGILFRLEAPSRVIDAWLAYCGLSLVGPWIPTLERRVPRALLREPRPTQIDVSLESDSGLVILECKFTEPDGGSCSQTRPISGESANRGLIQCTGAYVLQTNPVNSLTARCALTAKGVRYWEVIPQVLTIQSDVDRRPCPFSGGWYQWMRNLVACYAMCDTPPKQGAFIVVYADGPFPMARKIATRNWQDFVTLTSGRNVPLRTVSYQQLIEIAVAAAESPDRDVVERLRDWVHRKVGEVAANGPWADGATE